MNENLSKQVHCGTADPHPAHPLMGTDGLVSECAGTHDPDTNARAVRDLVVAVIAKMRIPVACTYCREVYDLTQVYNRDRSLTAVMWFSPCCHSLCRDHPRQGYERFSINLLTMPRPR